jgi:hypothetical protein
MGSHAGRRDQARAGARATPIRARPTTITWLATLERLVAEKGVADSQTLARYRDAWDRAADRTPHGMPIELRGDDFGGEGAAR